jgi:hypothetical protein
MLYAVGWVIFPPQFQQVLGGFADNFNTVPVSLVVGALKFVGVA